jgi:hypothetical protein
LEQKNVQSSLAALKRVAACRPHGRRVACQKEWCKKLLFLRVLGDIEHVLMTGIASCSSESAYALVNMIDGVPLYSFVSERILK